MRGFMRLLFMFGPMILRQVQKYQRNKERQRYQQQGRPPMRREAPRSNTEYRRNQRDMPPPPPRQPQMSEEERNFRLKEEDIMLDQETVQDYSGNNQSASHEMDYERSNDRNPSQDHPNQEQHQQEQRSIEAPENQSDDDGIVPSGRDKKDDDGFDLKDLFFEDGE